ncbi:hypothetical protein CEE45_11635 [Candidatus Heimdallarchaeota archaeon B3_Heim]|nr:MAG: hypothetical protein CEE45_11635 [Candidatus Heimdallarchaeota archaeon B3_Heim]
MLLPEEFVSLIPLWDLAFFLFGVPFVLWLNNKTRNDWICLGLGILYMVLYEIVFGPGPNLWAFFWFGLVVGYITDYWGVNSKKWKYHPWDSTFGYSYYVGFAWGMVSMFTLSISRIVEAPLDRFFLPGILLLIPMIIFEARFGETRRDQYFLYLRALCAFLAFYSADELGLLFIAIFVGSYIEFAGVNWIKNWLYIDSLSFIFLSFGYSLILMGAKMTYDLLVQNPIDPLPIIFFLTAIFFYAIDTFWWQKRIAVDTSKAVTAANQYREKYEG